MAEQDEFEQRFTLLGLAETLSPDVTIRASRVLSDTLEAPNSGVLQLPRISVDDDVRTEGRSLGPSRSPDLAIVATIGEGGMGRVHLARQRSLDREVAVKTLKEGALPTASAGLLREARLTGSLEHPGVIPVHALGLDDAGNPLLVMKRVEGVDWATLLADDAHPLWSVIAGSTDRLAANLGILTQVCRTVEFAHSRGVIHRDIKPENVMVGSYGEVYLVDWGIATTSKEARPKDGLVGTPAYMAPEMFLGEAIDERTDVYLLGSTLHEVLTKTLRHGGTTLTQVLQNVVASKPVTYDDSVPELLAALCNASTARPMNDRPANAQAFRDRLTEFLHHRSAMTLSVTAAERLRDLRALLDGAKDGGPPADLAAAYRLATEARFGFTESLREHATNATATAGLRDSVLALVELELRQEHADTADALLREVDGAHPSLATRVAEVRARDEERRRQAQRLQAMDRDLDPSLEAKSRFVVLKILVALSAAMIVFTHAAGMTARRLAVYGSIFMVMFVVILVWYRRRFFANAYSKKLAGLMLSASLLIVTERAVGAFLGVPVEHTLASNLWISAAAVAGGAIGVQPKLWAALPPLVVGATIIPVFPSFAPQILSAAFTVTFAALALVMWPRART